MFCSCLIYVCYVLLDAHHVLYVLLDMLHICVLLYVLNVVQYLLLSMLDIYVFSHVCCMLLTACYVFCVLFYLFIVVCAA